MSDTVSADSIKAQMPHTTLTLVLGEPTHKQIKMVIRELTANLMAVSCPWGHNKGYLGLLQDPAIYLARNGAAFTIPAAEPAVLDDPMEGLNGVDLRTLVQHILTTYAQISQPDLDDNMTEFNIGIDSGLPLAIYMRKQEKC